MIATANSTKSETKLPKGWRWVKLGEVCESVQSGFASGQRDSEGVIQLRMNNLDTRGNFVWDDFIRVPASHKNVAQFRLELNDVLFNNTNSKELVGKSALFTGYGEDVVFSNHFTRIRTCPDALIPGLLAAWLNLQWLMGIFASICNSWIGQSAVKPTKLLSLEIPLPPLPEQKRIAAILNDQMAAVESARKAAEARRAAVNALPSAYLRAVFPSPDKPLPKGWRWANMGDFITETRNGFGRRPLPGEVGPIVLRIADVSKGFIDLSNPRHGFMTDSEYDVYCVRPGDLLFIRVNGSADIVGRVALVGSDIGRVVFNDHLIRVRLRDGVLPEYLRLFCDSPGAREHMVASASTSAGQLTINRESLDSLDISVPPLLSNATLSECSANKLPECNTRARRRKGKWPRSTHCRQRCCARLLRENFEYG